MASRSNTTLVAHIDCPGGGQVWVDGTTLYIAHMSAPHGTSGAQSDPDLFAQTHPEDLRHFGLIPEFIGRFPVVTALQDLDEVALVRILTEPRNALVKQYQQLFSFEGVALDFEPQVLGVIALILKP